MFGGAKGKVSASSGSNGGCRMLGSNVDRLTLRRNRRRSVRQGTRLSVSGVITMFGSRRFTSWYVGILAASCLATVFRTFLYSPKGLLFSALMGIWVLSGVWVVIDTLRGARYLDVDGARAAYDRAARQMSVVTAGVMLLRIVIWVRLFFVDAEQGLLGPLGASGGGTRET